MATGKETPTAAAAVRAEDYKTTTAFLEKVGIGGIVGAEYNVNDCFSKVIGGFLDVISIERGKISCILNVKPPTLNGHGILLGAVVAAVAERVAIACAATVVLGEHQHLCLGEISISYLSAAPPNAQVVVDATMARSGRNQTVVAVDFRLKESQRIRATLYKTPLSNL